MGRISDMTSHFQAGSHNVISLRKVLTSGECTRRVRRGVRYWDMVMVSVPDPKYPKTQTGGATVTLPLYITALKRILWQGNVQRRMGLNARSVNLLGAISHQGVLCNYVNFSGLPVSQRHLIRSRRRNFVRCGEGIIPIMHVTRSR